MVRTCYHVLRLDWCGGTICRVRKVSLRRQLGPRTTQNFQEVRAADSPFSKVLAQRRDARR